jgi:LacI family transcriptional regulator
MMPKLTIADVAAKAGVSTATVSRALKGDPSVKEKTRAHVAAIADKLGFTPSAGGRLLSQGETAVVGLSLGCRDYETSRYVSLMHQNLSRQLSGQGWSLRLVLADEFEEMADRLGSFVLIGVSQDDPRIALCQQRNVPFVAIGASSLDVFWVAPDDRGGAEVAIECLAPYAGKALHILHHQSAPLNERLQSAFAHASALGLKVVPIAVAPGPMAGLAGYRALSAFLKVEARPHAIFAETDELALGAIAAFEDHGISPGRDVRVIGFDDLPHIAEGLTTLRQDFANIAKTALELLSEARNQQAARSVRIPVSLVRRKTC